ncbi:MAG TPA: MerR family transcriptional regulator [Kofleriaceae bacterium]|nr:MerR family transcriptional regulator [Kofleriaceae bacterium]
MDESWTLSELVTEVAARIAALPAPANGQVRAVPDERTVRYYGTIGLLDRPLAMRGRTALYGRRHLAQVVAIKRLQTMGRSLAEIQALWPTLDSLTLARMSGIQLLPGRPAGRAEFWKREPAATPTAAAAAASAVAPATPAAPPPVSALVAAAAPAAPAPAPVELRVELAPGVSLSIAMSDDIALSSADVRAIRAAAAPLLAELAHCRLTANPGGEEP